MPYQIISSLIIFQHIKSYIICDENKSIIGRENTVLNISNLSPLFNNFKRSYIFILHVMSANSNGEERVGVWGGVGGERGVVRIIKQTIPTGGIV